MHLDETGGMRAIGGLALTLVTGCMTDTTGNSCPWVPGSDGSCPDRGSGSSPSSSYHSFDAPRFLDVPGARRVLVRSAERGELAREQLAAARDGDAEPARDYAPIFDRYQLPVACSTVCLIGWRDEGDARVRTMIYDGASWSLPRVHAGSIREPAVAADGDLLLVAWHSFVGEVGQIELRRLDRAGAVIGTATLATGASHGHLSLTAGAGGGLLTWQHADPVTLDPDGSQHAQTWVDAQLLGADGMPSGSPLQLATANGDDDYYRAAPAAVVDGAYRVVHGELAGGATWLVVDPVARTIGSAMIAGLPAQSWVEQIVPLAQGAVVSLRSTEPSVALISGDAITAIAPIETAGEAPAIAPGAAGIDLAYGRDGSLYLEGRDAVLSPVSEPVVLAGRYEIDSGCTAGRGGGPGGVLALGALARATSRRRRTPACT